MGIRGRIRCSSSASTLSLDIVRDRLVEQFVRPSFELGWVCHFVPHKLDGLLDLLFGDRFISSSTQYDALAAIKSPCLGIRHDFVKPHMALEGQTPAQAAGP